MSEADSFVGGVTHGNGRFRLRGFPVLVCPEKESDRKMVDSPLIHLMGSGTSDVPSPESLIDVVCGMWRNGTSSVRYCYRRRHPS